jgi:transcription elongation factor GreA-like protein
MKQEESARKPEREQCHDYRPENSYTVGDAIFHNEWGIGKVVSKERTSGGDRAIVVDFDKLGEHRLLENVVVEPDAG